jgi:LuxR family transcriptional regulator, quorum-sensing system regulator SdiA
MPQTTQRKNQAGGYKDKTLLEQSGSYLLQNNFQLKKQLLFCEKLFDSITSAIMVMDMNNMRLVWANDCFYKLLGLNKNRKIIPEKIMNRYHPDDSDFLFQAKKYLEQNRNGTFTALYRFKNLKGKYLWFYTSVNVFRDIPEEDIFEVVAVSNCFSKQLTYHKNLKFFTQDQLHDLNRKHISKITKRELQVIKYFSNGFKTREIAELLGLSFHTVNNHRKNILKKLELKNLAALVNFAVENGLD